jgi:nicotinate-nucleotide adenylyltransferase
VNRSERGTVRKTPQGPAKRTGTKRIGLFGGTFDPVHHGHLRAGEEIRQAFSLSWVEFLPAKIPPHKTDLPLTDVSHRVAMLRLAVERNPYFRVSEVEASREGVSYLVDTLEAYREHYPADVDLYFLMGMDSFQEVATWHRYPLLFSLSHFVVITRPGYKRPGLSEVVSQDVASCFAPCQAETHCLEHTSGHRVYFQETTLLDISASRVRGWIREERSVRYLVPERVWEYIQENGLYASTRKNGDVDSQSQK